MITQKELKKKFHYDFKTGLLTRLSTGNIFSVPDNVGYFSVDINKKKYRVHRLAWLYVYGEMPKEQIDHINHDKTDNRICNLREVSNTENRRNMSLDKRNKNGITGIDFYKKTKLWRACIRANGKHKHLGYFKNKVDAILARKKAEIKYGFHENHGKPIKI